MLTKSCKVSPSINVVFGFMCFLFFFLERGVEVISCLVSSHRDEKVESQRYTLLYSNLMVSKHISKRYLCCHAACVEYNGISNRCGPHGNQKFM